MKQRATGKPGLPVTVGWKEYVQLPDWGIPHVKAKIDTGARTSALDVVRYELHADPSGGLVADLGLALQRRHPEKLTIVRVPVVRLVVVRNSGGACEERPLIETTLRLGPVTKRILLTITRRTSMRFRMLLGRKALEGDFIVDVSRKYLLRSAK